MLILLLPQNTVDVSSSIALHPHSESCFSRFPSPGGS